MTIQIKRPTGNERPLLKPMSARDAGYYDGLRDGDLMQCDNDDLRYPFLLSAWFPLVMVALLMALIALGVAVYHITSAAFAIGGV